MTIHEAMQLLNQNVSQVMVGTQEASKLIFTCLLVSGNVLLEDVPGTGKTKLAKTIARSLGIDFKRIQFTPDLLPSDILGINMYHPKDEDFKFKRGPIFSSFILADEINRASPRTQSSLLEAMEEKQVSVDGVTYPLEEPFFVMATQNPIENTGTYPLPEAQLDRFTMCLSLGYPTMDEEQVMLLLHGQEDPLDHIVPVLSKEDLSELKLQWQNVYMHEDLYRYLLQIVDHTRHHTSLSLGISPRASLIMVKCVKAYAAIQGRNYVLPDDIQALCIPVFAHRLVSNGFSYQQEGHPRSILQDILKEVPVPTEDFSRG